MKKVMMIGGICQNQYFMIGNTPYYVGYWIQPNGIIQALNQDSGHYEYFTYQTLISLTK